MTCRQVATPYQVGLTRTTFHTPPSILPNVTPGVRTTAGTPMSTEVHQSHVLNAGGGWGGRTVISIPEIPSPSPESQETLGLHGETQSLELVAMEGEEPLSPHNLIFSTSSQGARSDDSAPASPSTASTVSCSMEGSRCFTS